jgi:hypothetical protein
VPTNTRNFDKGSKAEHQSGANSENARRFFQVSLSDLKSNQRTQHIAFFPTCRFDLDEIDNWCASRALTNEG